MLKVTESKSGRRYIEDGLGKLVREDLPDLEFDLQKYSRQDIAELIPILQVFADTGRLPEPEKGGR